MTKSPKLPRGIIWIQANISYTNFSQFQSWEVGEVNQSKVILLQSLKCVPASKNWGSVYVSGPWDQLHAKNLNFSKYCPYACHKYCFGSAAMHQNSCRCLELHGRCGKHTHRKTCTSPHLRKQKYPYKCPMLYQQQYVPANTIAFLSQLHLYHVWALPLPIAELLLLFTPLPYLRILSV